MPRPLLRFFALLILALLGAPVAMHVVLHDLEHHEAEHSALEFGETDHGTHEHPVVSSGVPQLPRVSAAAAALPPVITVPQSVYIDRNVLSHGALRSRDGVGLPLLLSTLLI